MTVKSEFFLLTHLLSVISMLFDEPMTLSLFFPLFYLISWTVQHYVIIEKHNVFNFNTVLIVEKKRIVQFRYENVNCLSLVWAWQCILMRSRANTSFSSRSNNFRLNYWRLVFNWHFTINLNVDENRNTQKRCAIIGPDHLQIDPKWAINNAIWLW